jgi:hypothetical protein
MREVFALLEKARKRIQTADETAPNRNSSYHKARIRAQLDLLDYFEREINKIYLKMGE